LQDEPNVCTNITFSFDSNFFSESAKNRRAAKKAAKRKADDNLVRAFKDDMEVKKKCLTLCNYERVVQSSGLFRMTLSVDFKMSEEFKKKQSRVSRNFNRKWEGEPACFERQMGPNFGECRNDYNWQQFEASPSSVFVSVSFQS
jgi:hypothetical protein